MRRPLVAAILAAAVLAAPAAASPTVRMTILHYVRGCHVWSSTNAPAATLRITRGTRVEIRISCPMDFDLAQLSGPKLALGDRRLYGGTTHALVFRLRGTYAFRLTNVQSSEQLALQTLGPDNTVTLTVVVR